MTAKLEVRGSRNLEARLRRIASDVTSATDRAIVLGAEEVRSEAVRRIQRGGRTGRTYTTTFWTDGQGQLRVGRPRPAHQASAPGEYPKSDSGRLASHIFARLIARGVAEAGTDVVYGGYLERGTSRMAARPWLLRTFKELRPRIVDRIRRALADDIRRHTK